MLKKYINSIKKGLPMKKTLLAASLFSSSMFFASEFNNQSTTTGTINTIKNIAQMLAGSSTTHYVGERLFVDLPNVYVKNTPTNLKTLLKPTWPRIARSSKVGLGLTAIIHCYCKD